MELSSFKTQLIMRNLQIDAIVRVVFNKKALVEKRNYKP
jgi:hypothetical protein